MRRIKFNCLKISLFVFILFFIYLSTGYALEQILSPNGQIVVNCNIHINSSPYPPGERFYFNVQFQGRPVLKDSQLGLFFVDKDPLARDFRIYHVKRERGVEDYSIFGKQKHVHQLYHQVTFSMQERVPPFRILKIIFRVTDEGVAFRYLIPEQSEIRFFEISEEQTSFYLAGDLHCYGSLLSGFHTNYECDITEMSFTSLVPTDLIGCPVLFHPEDGPWVAITEANLQNYAGMALSRMTGQKALQCVLPTNLGNPPAKVNGTTPFLTPWRVLLIGEKPGDLIESNFITSLNDSSILKDISWIRPGKVVGPGWTNFWMGGSTGQGGMDTATLSRYLDFAAESNLEYLLIPAGWYGNPNDPYADITKPVSSLDWETILSQSREDDVGVILWVNANCLQNQMDTAFPLYQKWGVKGVLVDGLRQEDQESVIHLHQVLKKAALHQLFVNLRGVYKPTGIRRTYPHLLTREGVLGMEYNKMSSQCDPEHEMLLPFTRMLAGPMDFSPGCFRNVMKENFSADTLPPVAMGTRCRQLAMYVVFESPLQMCVDYPGAYRNQAGFEFLKDVPTTWDSTIVVDAKVGDFIAMARRKNDIWYLGCMSDWTARELTIPLQFLNEGVYEAEIFSDPANVQFNPTGIQIRKIRVRSGDTVYPAMGPGGGYVVRFKPVNDE